MAPRSEDSIGRSRPNLDQVLDRKLESRPPNRASDASTSAFISILTSAVFCLCLLSPLGSRAQSSTLTTQADAEISIRSISVAKFRDNVSGIYAKPMSAALFDLVRQDKQWTLVGSQLDTRESLEDLEDQAPLVLKLVGKADYDAVLAGQITKGPGGLNLTLDLFASKTGKLLLQAKLEHYQGFDIEDIKGQLKQVYSSLRKKLPFDGWVLSRKGNVVTINLGANQGAAPNQELPVVLILRLQRHPKFNFIVGADRELIGKIRLQQVDENLSFGTVISEREDGLIRVGNKVMTDSMIDHAAQGIADGDKIVTPVENPVAFGQAPAEWHPKSAPSLGRLTLMAGLTDYTLANDLSQSGGLSSTNPLAPTVQFQGELWFNESFYAQVAITQWVFSVSDPLGGGTPGRLNVSTGMYSILGGYHVYAPNGLKGPLFDAAAGFVTYNAKVDQSSPRPAFTSETYNGIDLRLGTSFPIDWWVGHELRIGGDLDTVLFPSLSEAPVSSGSSQNSIVGFQLHGEYGLSDRMKIRAQLNYNGFSSSFTGGGSRPETASSSSHHLIGLLGGVDFLF